MEKKIIMAVMKGNHTVADIGDHLGITFHLAVHQLSIKIDGMVDKGMLSERNGQIDINKTWMKRNLSNG